MHLWLHEHYLAVTQHGLPETAKDGQQSNPPRPRPPNRYLCLRRGTLPRAPKQSSLNPHAPQPARTPLCAPQSVQLGASGPRRIDRGD